MNITIIGAGPIGCYAGYLLAKEGHAVTIYENHPQIGSPVQCTGILTSDFDEFGFPIDSFLVNTIDTIEVFSPAQQKVVIKQKDYIVCRIKFDNFFADKARKAGATILLNHSFSRKEGKELIITDSKAGKELLIKPDIVIAADGPLSPTAKAYGFYLSERENYYGIQAVVTGKFEPHTIKTYFGNEICPGLFAWVAPESATSARVGVATLKNSKHYFNKLMKEHNFVAKEIQAGTIPVYHPRQKLHHENCYVVGDAAGYVKATTLGGLIPGLKQAEVLARSIITGESYERGCTSLRKRLLLHRRVHTIFEKFSDPDWNRLVSYVAQPRVQAVFERYTRDNPIPLVGMALLKEPRLLRFGKYLY